MPKNITQYNVFIGSPGGLDEERKRFRATLEKCSQHYGLDKDIRFHPVGWEDTIGGVGRPQAQINEDLRQCDYAVFVLHDRWGSPTGSGHASGTEEEWELAEDLYKANKIRNIALFFKKVDAGKLSDPGDQLKPVVAFKKKIEDEKRYLFKQYERIDEFSDTLDGHLAKWLKEHETARASLSLGDTSTKLPTTTVAETAGPDFDYWIEEASKNPNDHTKDYTVALFCASKAVDAAKSEVQWAKAKNAWGVSQLHLGKVDKSISAFTEIVDRLSKSIDLDSRSLAAHALFNKGFTLGTLGRHEDAIAVYDDILARFGTATELPLREHVVIALYSKGFALGMLERYDEAIIVYDDLLARFGAATELPLRANVAKALVNKGYMLGMLVRGEEAIAVYDDVVDRFGTATESSLRDQVDKALMDKANMLVMLGRGEDAIEVYEYLITR